MQKKQRKVHHLLTVGLCLGVLALGVRTSSAARSAPVTVTNTTANPVPASITNTASSPVPTQNVGGGATTQVGQPVSNLVNLVCTGKGILCSSLGTNGVGYSVPAGKALVITDIEWVFTEFTNASAGLAETMAIFLNVPGTTVVGLAQFTSVLDGTAHGGGQSHLTTGVVVPAGNGVSLSPTGAGGNGIGFLQGYLVSNQ